MKSVCVYCGSKSGTSAQFKDLAIKIGHFLAEKQIRLVFGAGNIGLMGSLADACLEKNGTVLGVIPQHLVEWEVAHQGLSELKIVQTMHERKAIMANESDAFLAIPGGYGTLDELFEIITWQQLKLHTKPIAIINQGGFYDALKGHIESMYQHGFISDEHLQMLTFYETFEDWSQTLQLS